MEGYTESAGTTSGTIVFKLNGIAQRLLSPVWHIVKQPCSCDKAAENQSFRTLELYTMLRVQAVPGMNQHPSAEQGGISDFNSMANQAQWSMLLATTSFLAYRRSINWCSVLDLQRHNLFAILPGAIEAMLLCVS